MSARISSLCKLYRAIGDVRKFGRSSHGTKSASPEFFRSIRQLPTEGQDKLAFIMGFSIRETSLVMSLGALPTIEFSSLCKLYRAIRDERKFGRSSHGTK